MDFVHTHKNVLTFYEVTYETGSFCRVIIKGHFLVALLVILYDQSVCFYAAL